VSEIATGFLARLKQRKLVQWALAYVAFAFALIQVLDVIAQRFGWPDQIEKLLIFALAMGFLVALVLAWYHGERGAQKVSGTEIVILALLLAIGGGLLWRFERATPATGSLRAASSTDAAQRNPGATPASIPIAAIPAKSIAVLPFENLSGDKDNAYFADGMQDLILTKLADIGDLKVISRTSTAKYESHPDNLKTIAQQLGVATILEGSVQKAGNQVLINVQLINASSDSHVWAQSYQRTLDNIFGVEGEVAQKIADALKARLSPVESAQLAALPTTNQAAYDLFLRAEYQAHKGNVNYVPADFRAAIPLYRQAIQKDPNFALAYAQLSFAESGVVWFGSGEDDVKPLVADSLAQAEKALALQPRLVAGYLALGYNAYWGRQDYPASLKAFAAALKLRPNDADALAATGYVLRRQGRFDEAIAAMRRALVLDPRDSDVADNLGETCAAVGRTAEAAQFYERAMALDPDNYQARWDYSGLILASSGDVARALKMAQGDAPLLQLERVQLLTYQRKYRDALALLADIPDAANAFDYQSGPKTLWQANLHRLMGDDAQARPLYARALSESRARIARLTGNADKLGFVWNHVGAAELGLGKLDDALAAAAKSQALSIQSGDRFFALGVTQLNAALYAQAGRADLALPLLAKAPLASPGIGTLYPPVTLGFDPAWDPVRNDPRFQALLKKYARYKPAAVDAIAPSAADPATPASAAVNEAAHD
jgi:TolB-like protein/Tfp pilus assembly protein PilF